MSTDNNEQFDVYVVTTFADKADKEGVTDQALLNASQEIFAGLFDASLKGSLIKKRIASGNRNTGKSGGNRAIVSIKRDGKLFFLYLFSKKEKDNISDKELNALKEYGELMFSQTEESLCAMLKGGLLRKL